MSKAKIGTIEAIFITLTAIVPLTVTSLPITIINELKSSSLLNIFYVTIICTLIGFLIYFLFKKFPGFDIIDVSNYLGGSIFRNIIGFIFIFYFIISSSLLLRNFCEGLDVIYFHYTNIIFMILIFVISITITNYLGFNSTIRTTTIIFPITLLSILLLFFGNIDSFKFQKIFPILGEGFEKTFALGLSNIGAFAGITYIYLLPPLLKNPKQFKIVSVLSGLLSGFFIFICIASLLFMFSIFISTNELMPLFIVSRYIEFGNFFQRFESLFLLIWIISFCCYLSISCKFSTAIFTKIFNLKDSSQLINIFAILIFAIAILPKNYIMSSFFEYYIYRYFTIAIIIIGLVILFLSNLKKKVSR